MVGDSLYAVWKDGAWVASTKDAPGAILFVVVKLPVAMGPYLAESVHFAMDTTTFMTAFPRGTTTQSFVQRYRKSRAVKAAWGCRLDARKIGVAGLSFNVQTLISSFSAAAVFAQWETKYLAGGGRGEKRDREEEEEEGEDTIHYDDDEEPEGKKQRVV